jgi:hypothetical protein
MANSAPCCFAIWIDSGKNEPRRLLETYGVRWKGRHPLGPTSGCSLE